MTGDQAHTGAAGLTDSDSGHGWVYTVGGAVYELTTGGLGWILRGITDTGRPTERCFGDRLRAEHLFFRTVADAIITHRPYTCEARIGDAHLVLTRVDTAWHLAESSATPLAAAFSDEPSGLHAWQERASELTREAAKGPLLRSRR